MLKKIKKYFSRLWKALWNSTTIDEKAEAEAALNETKSRLKAMRRELVDVKNAFKNVASQSKDVFDAAKGNKRRGRKPSRKYKKTKK